MIVNGLKPKKQIQKKKYTDMKSFLKNHKITRDSSKIDLTIYKYIKNNVDIDWNDVDLVNIDRSYIIERKKKLEQYIDKLNNLKKLPLIKQRTPEWFQLRDNRITASVLDEVLKENNMKTAKKKAGVIKEITDYSTIAPLKWGVMFEPMATRCYSQERNNIEIHEFGLVTNENINNFGASPDGINDMGIMIEIKCPYSRKIVDDDIPEKYYLQIQGQLAVCELNECDYIECNFKVFDTIENYIQSIPDDSVVNHGVIAEFKNNEKNEYEYIYSPPYMKKLDAFDYIKEHISNHDDTSGLVFIKYTPWSLVEMNIQRIYFDEKNWHQNVVPKIISFWEKVVECKNLPVEEPVIKPKIQFIDDD